MSAVATGFTNSDVTLLQVDIIGNNKKIFQFETVFLMYLEGSSAGKVNISGWLYQ